MARSSFDTFSRLHARVRDAEHVYMVLVAGLIGIGGGFAAVGFRYLIGMVQQIAWQASDLPYLMGLADEDAPGRFQNLTLAYLGSLPAWWIILAPAVGGGLCALIVYYFAREAKGHGVPEVMEAVALRGGRIRPRVVFAKMLASAISIGTGGSVGREGPIVQIGSAFGSTIGQWLRMDERRMRTLVGCGAAAGIAATFNAPVAGALFALEVILADFGVAQFSPIVISSVVATVIGHHYLEAKPAFEVPLYGLVNYNELFAYALLGIIAGLVALAFVKILYFSEDAFDAVKVWPPAKAIFGGAIIGVIALWYPQIFGVGYEAIDQSLAGNMPGLLALTLIAIKIIAVGITIGSGGSGGIFAPSLFIGAMTGGAFGTLVHSIWPEASAPPGAYALVGMVAVVAATTHAPITSIVIIFELTKDYEIMLSLMVSAIIATLVATQLQYGSIYTIKLLRRGVDIHKGQDINLLKHLSVRDAMRDDHVTVQPDAGLTQVIARLVGHPGYSVFVVDDDRRLLGIITPHHSRMMLTDSAAFQDLIIARDIMGDAESIAVSPDDTLADAMRRLAQYRGEVPVVTDGRLVGVIWPEDVIERYNAELFKRDVASGVATSMQSRWRTERLPIAADTSISELRVPEAFIGLSVADLDIRNRYNSTVLLIRREGEAAGKTQNAVPTAEYVFQRGDMMLVMGPDDQIRRLERGHQPMA